MVKSAKLSPPLAVADCSEQAALIAGSKTGPPPRRAEFLQVHPILGDLAGRATKIAAVGEVGLVAV